MARIVKNESTNGSCSYKVTIPKTIGEYMYENYGPNVKITPYKNGVKILPIKEGNNE